MSTGYIHGATDAREVARLEKQARFFAPFTFSRLPLQPGMRVLDLGTGVGAMAGLLQTSFPGVEVIGLDLSNTQLAAARQNHREVPVTRGDAARMPFADSTFDAVHASWLLEHVPSPVAVLREVRRVLKPGAWCHFLEVDNATLKVTPQLDAVASMMRALYGAQLGAGGDPFIGERMHRLLRSAGFRRFELDRPLLDGNGRDPVFFQAFIDELAEIFEGLDESTNDAGLIRSAAEALRGLIRQPGAGLQYRPVVARAVK